MKLGTPIDTPAKTDTAATRNVSLRALLIYTATALMLVGLIALSITAILKPASESVAVVPTNGAEETLVSATPNKALPLVNRCPQTARACIDLGLRLGWIQDGGYIVYGPVPVMPGSPEDEGSVVTPHGVFKVLRKNAHEWSNEFNQPMPNAVYFTKNGIALHEGSLYHGSHGCVHLSKRASKVFFDSLQVGNEIVVIP